MVKKNLKLRSQRPNNLQKLQRYLVAFPVIALIIKFIVVGNIQGGGWYGADGENYTAGVDGLLNMGFFSNEPKLSYWPAGYPLLLWPLATISIPKFFYLISILQSVFYAYATYFLTNSLLKSNLKKFAFAISLIISFNPTLSLSTLAVGYEAPIAACLMMATGIVIKLQNSPNDRKFWINVAFTSFWFALTIFMQPRFLLVGIVYFIYLAMQLGNKKNLAWILMISVAMMSVGPAIMIARNIQVIEQATISTNLGVTMAIGAGDTTSGGYARTGPEVPCSPNASGATPTDNQRVKCVLKWYLKNPLKTLKLAYNKSQFFWSPWSGPLANGTMARNPWLKIAPTQSLRKTEGGANLVNGWVGKTVSYVWIIGQLLFLYLGYRELRKIGSIEKFLSNLILIPIVISWLISIGTIGDHRFRLPTMSLSLILQVVGLLTVRDKVSKAL
jgi:hypothetical protein